jgi:hypothetical protein
MPENIDEHSKQLLELLRRDWWKIAVLLAFVTLVAMAVARHEPFTDEGQAWLLARDVSFFSLIFRHCAYEGHPCLWYLLLFIPAKLGLPYYTMNIISAVVATFTVFLLLWRSPFPSYIRALLPFTYFFFYQYAVVARGYVLVAPLLFLTAMLYEKRTRHPYLFAVLLSLLLNAELATALAALGIFAFHWIDLRHQWRGLEVHRKKAQLLSSLIFAASFVFMIITMWSPSDSQTKPDFVITLKQFWTVFLRNFLDGSITNYWYLTLVVLVVSCLWFRSRKVLLLYLLPTFLFFLLVATLPSSVFHQGVFFLVWIFVLWVSFEREDRPEANGRSGAQVLKILVIVCMLIVIGVQLYWGISAFAYDRSNVYSGTYDVAELIKENRLEGAKIFVVGGQPTTGVNLFFDHNIFADLNNGDRDRAFWFQTTANKIPWSLDEAAMRTITKERPDMVVVSVASLKKRGLDDLNRFLSGTGYLAIGPFLGRMIWKQHRYVEPAYSYYILFNTRKFSPPE